MGSLQWELSKHASLLKERPVSNVDMDVHTFIKNELQRITSNDKPRFISSKRNSHILYKNGSQPIRSDINTALRSPLIDYIKYPDKNLDQDTKPAELFSYTKYFKFYKQDQESGDSVLNFINTNQKSRSKVTSKLVTLKSTEDDRPNLSPSQNQLESRLPPTTIKINESKMAKTKNLSVLELLKNKGKLIAKAYSVYSL